MENKKDCLWGSVYFKNQAKDSISEPNIRQFKTLATEERWSVDTWEPNDTCPAAYFVFCLSRTEVDIWCHTRSTFVEYCRLNTKCVYSQTSIRENGSLPYGIFELRELMSPSVHEFVYIIKKNMVINAAR